MNKVNINSITDRQKESGNNLVFSYMTLRNLIGFSGMALPWVLALTTKKDVTDRHLEASISDYYYTGNGDILVVILSILAVFLLTYNGYNWKEKVWSVIAAICALGVAFSPTVTKYDRLAFSVHSDISEVPKWFGMERHLYFAAIFFIVLAIISLRYFPKSDTASVKTADGKRTPKAKRNIVYIVCGWVMLLCVAGLALFFIVKPWKEAIGDFPIIFYAEAIAIHAFGISWLTKGETLWPDGEHYVKTGYRQFRSFLKDPK